MSKKIMFNDKYGLTQAVLEGRKTMTRRIGKPRRKMYGICMGPMDNGEFYPSAYEVGDVLAVAQSYKNIEEYNPESYEDVMLDQGTICEASHPYSHLMKSGGWDNKMFVRADLMPHRIRITDIKIERLQDISDEDCLKEGVIKSYIGYYVPGIQCKDWEKESHIDTEDYHTWKLFPTPREAFAALIDKVSGKGTWESNPWVFAYTFELVKGGKNE